MKKSLLLLLFLVSCDSNLESVPMHVSDLSGVYEVTTNDAAYRLTLVENLNIYASSLNRTRDGEDDRTHQMECSILDDLETTEVNCTGDDASVSMGTHTGTEMEVTFDFTNYPSESVVLQRVL